MRVRLTPNASRDQIIGIGADAMGRSHLKIAVTAAPELNRANKALIKFLAKQWHLPKTKITLRSGTKNRIKTLCIQDPNSETFEALIDWARDQVRQFD